jgi:AcrR family transcriptional regulator
MQLGAADMYESTSAEHSVCYRIWYSEQSVRGDILFRQAHIEKAVHYQTSVQNCSPRTREAAVKQEKVDRRSQRTQRLVFAAFTELVTEKHYDEISVQDILDRAGIGRTTFYSHYFDKDDVLETITEQLVELLMRQVAQSAARQRIVPSLDVFQHIAQSPDQHFRAFMRGHASEHLWEALQTAFCKAVEPALAALCAESELTSPTIPLNVISQYLVSTLFSLLKWWLSADMPYSPEEMDSIFQRLAWPGVWALLKPDTAHSYGPIGS